jgi:hypothetical protein
MTMKKLLCICMLMIAVIFMPVSLSFAQGGNISGSLGLETNNGKVVHGDWIRVLLVTEKFEVKKDTKISGMDKHKRMESIMNAHIAFFKKVREKMENPGYVAATTLTTSDGAFKFADVKEGKYYIVVAFPATINGRKVAWQVMVAVHAGKATHIKLRNNNLALPTYFRNK